MHVVRNHDPGSFLLLVMCTVPWVLETCFWCTWGVPPSSTMHDCTWPLKTMAYFYTWEPQHCCANMGPMWSCFSIELLYLNGKIARHLVKNKHKKYTCYLVSWKMRLAYGPQMINIAYSTFTNNLIRVENSIW